LLYLAPAPTPPSLPVSLISHVEAVVPVILIRILGFDGALDDLGAWLPADFEPDCSVDALPGVAFPSTLPMAFGSASLLGFVGTTRKGL